MLFRLISFLHHWMAAARAEDMDVLEGLVEAIKVQVPQELMTLGVR
jgi:hypothetical protein